MERKVSCVFFFLEERDREQKKQKCGWKEKKNTESKIKIKKVVK